jgi:hypothetical protein
MKTYTRVPLAVEALFSTDGRIKPQKLYFDGNCFEIERILAVRNHCPQVVGCIAPVEYAVLIDGIHKMIYYEADTGTWFSIRESSHA